MSELPLERALRAERRIRELEAELSRLRALTTQHQRHIDYLEGTAMPHARRQENANGGNNIPDSIILLSSSGQAGVIELGLALLLGALVLLHLLHFIAAGGTLYRMRLVSHQANLVLGQPYLDRHGDHRTYQEKQREGFDRKAPPITALGALCVAFAGILVGLWYLQFRADNYFDWRGWLPLSAGLLIAAWGWWRLLVLVAVCGV